MEGNGFENFSKYPFESDASFQEGLSSILESAQQKGTASDELNTVIGRAKAYYYSSITGINITWEDYVTYRSTTDGQANQPESNPPKLSQTGNSPKDTPSESDSKELSFSEITALIQSGETHLIPNNEVIPQGVNESAPSEPNVPQRKKPWEMQSNLESSTD